MEKLFCVFILVPLLVLTTSCGGGGGGQNSINLTYSPPPAFVVGQAISPLAPIVTGSASSYAVTPALPAGLTLNSTTGVISGTPTAVTPPTSFTVTATNTAGGSTSAALSITVNDVTPAISTARTNYVFTTEVPASVVPVNSGGAVTKWSIDPQLPEGLSINSGTGAIEGTPTVASAAAEYALAAQNSGGTSVLRLTLSVESGVFFDLGHASSVNVLHWNGSRVLSSDDKGNWILWDEASATSVARGRSTVQLYPAADLAGTTLIIRTGTGFEARSGVDGHLITSFDVAASWWKIAEDGSYFAAGSNTAVSIWSATGQLMFSRSGDYSSSIAFAAAGELRIAQGAAGNQVIENISTVTGDSSITAAFEGTFFSWFSDGGRFFTQVKRVTTTSATVRVYSRSAVQEDMMTLPVSSTLPSFLGGTGNWFWYDDIQLQVFAVGASSTPAATFNRAGGLSIAVGNRLAVPHEQSLRLIDFSGPVPTESAYALPNQASKWAPISASRWLLANFDGAVYESSTLGDAKYFNTGRTYSIAASPQRIAISTASNQILYFDTNTRQLQGSIDLHGLPAVVAMSGDGSVLAAELNVGRYPPASHDASVKFYSLPSGTEIATWPYTDSGPFPDTTLRLSATGDVVGVILGDTIAHGGPKREVRGISGTPLIYSDTTYKGFEGYPTLRISPDGQLIAVATALWSASSTVNIFRNGSQTASIAGWPAAWIDNERLLIATDTGAAIYSATGQLLDEGALKLNGAEITPVSSDAVYGSNLVLSIKTGETIWSSPNESTGPGAVAGSHIVFPSGTTVRIESY